MFNKFIKIVPLLVSLLVSPSFADNSSAIQYYNQSAQAVSRKDFQQAEGLLKQSLSECDASCRVKSTILGNLGFVYLNEQKYDQAEATFLEAASLPQSRPELINLQANLSMVYLSTNRLDRAIAALEKLVELAPGTPTANTEYLGRVYVNLGSMYLKNGARDKAVGAYGQAIPILEQHLSANDLFLSTVKKDYKTLSNLPADRMVLTAPILEIDRLAADAFRKGDKVKAEEYYMKALALTTQEFGPQHPAIPAYQHFLAEARQIDCGPDYLKQLDKGNVHWSDRTHKLLVYFEPSETLANWKPSYNERVKQALITWNSALDNHFQLIYTNTPRDANVFVQWVDQTIPNPDGETALGVFKPIVKDQFLDQGRIVFDLKQPIQNEQRLYATILHEVGHLMGLQGHSTNPVDIMYRANDPGAVPTMQLSNRDVETIRQVYHIK